MIVKPIKDVHEFKIAILIIMVSCFAAGFLVGVWLGPA